MAPQRAASVIFVRHGETSFNSENRLQGQRDIPLNGRGREQAHAVGRFLRDHRSPEIARLESSDAFWSSPLARTRETMELARAAMGLPPALYHCDPRLKELSFGAWEGLTWAEVDAKYPGARRIRNADKWTFRPPGGESYADLADRMKTWLAEHDGAVFVVAHGGVARALMALLAGVPPEVAAECEIHQGRVLIFERGGFAWIG
jgi:probable phosphoglycerate mutase